MDTAHKLRRHVPLLRLRPGDAPDRLDMGHPLLASPAHKLRRAAQWLYTLSGSYRNYNRALFPRVVFETLYRQMDSPSLDTRDGGDSLSYLCPIQRPQHPRHLPRHRTLGRTYCLVAHSFRERQTGSGDIKLNNYIATATHERRLL